MFDGKLIHLVAMANVSSEGADALRQGFPMPPSRMTTTVRAILSRAIVAIPDILEDREYVLGQRRGPQASEAVSLSRCCARATRSERSPSHELGPDSSLKSKRPTNSSACCRRP